VTALRISSALHILPKRRNLRDLAGLPIRYAKFCPLACPV
jgi:hypothetical protein